MNIQGGGLSFSFTANNEKLLAVINENKRAITEFRQTAEKGGANIDKAFANITAAIEATKDKIGEVIDTNRSAVNELSAQAAQLGQKASDAFMAGRYREYETLQRQQQALEAEIGVRKRVIAEAEREGDALVAQEQAMRKEYDAAKQAESGHESLRAQLRRVTQELAQMERNGQRGTEAFEQLRKKAGELADAIGDAQAQAKIFSHDNQGLQGVISGMQGVVGVFSAAQGAVGIFSDKNEELTRIMTKVQSLMAITMGLQQVANTLNKDSAFMLTTVARAKTLLAMATNKLSVALGISTVAAKALMATLTLGLSVAITGAIALMTRLRSKEEDATKATDGMRKAFGEFHKETASKSANLVGTYQRLSREYAKLTTAAQKTAWIKENAKEFENLGLAIGGVTDADSIFIKNTTAVVKSLELRAKAMALQNLQTKAYEEYYKKVVNADNSVKGGGFYTKQKKETSTTFKDEWKQAGVTLDDVETKTTQSGATVSTSTTTYTLTQKAINKINAYRIQQAKATNKKIHADAQAELDKTTGYVEKELEATNKQIQKLGVLSTTPEKQNGPGDGNKKDTDALTAALNQRKALYEKYYKWVNSGDETVREAAKQEFAGLLDEGATYLQYLQGQRDKITEAIGDGAASAAQKDALSKINNAIAEETKATVLAEFDAELQRQLNGANSLMEKLEVLEAMRKELESDTSGLAQQKSERLDTEESSLQDNAGQSEQDARQALADYYAAKTDYEKQYILKRKELELKAQSETDERRKAMYQQVLATLDAAHALKNVQDYESLLQEYRSYEQKRADIAEDFDKKIALARENGNTELEANLTKAKQRSLLAVDFEELKGSPEYIRAFEDLQNTSTETLQVLLQRMEEVKETAGTALNPEDLKVYTDTMTQIANELNTRNPFKAIRDGYKEMRAAEKELSAAEAELKKVRAQGLAGTAAETTALNKYIAAKDKYLRKNTQVKKSEKEAINSLKQLFSETTNLGNAIGGEAGEIVSLIGDVGTFTMSAIEGFTTASEASAVAIQTVEKASVILAVISAALQIATKIASLFTKDNQEYEKAKEAYEAYISVLDDVIDKQKELVATMDGENALNSYKYALDLIELSEESARTLGKLRLNDGASAGSHSIGVRQRRNITEEALRQANAALGEDVVDQLMTGRMTALFDLTIDELETLKEQAPIFWAQLDEEARDYLETIIETKERTEEMKDTLNETLTGVSFDSLSDDFLSALEDMDASAKDITNNISEYMRKALIRDMFNTQYKSELKRWYQMWSDAMKADSENGSEISPDERNALDTLRDSIVTGATNAAKEINDLFATSAADGTLSGAIATASQESIDLLAGQTNAVRQNQVESLNLMREQLMHLSNIDTGIGAIAERVQRILNKMGDSGTDYRSQGITNV